MENGRNKRQCGGVKTMETWENTEGEKELNGSGKVSE